jgi:glutamate dehydrogenase
MLRETIVDKNTKQPLNEKIASSNNKIHTPALKNSALNNSVVDNSAHYLAAHLFSKVAMEDVARVSLVEQEQLASSALNYLRSRNSHEASIRLVDGLLPNTTILEIINDDMPFLLDSALAELNERGIEPKLVAHPIIGIIREENGALTSISNALDLKSRESLIHIHLPFMALEAERASLIEALTLAYQDVQRSVADWAPMKERLAQAIIAYKTNPPPLETSEISEAIAFLEWLQADHFILLGLRDYRFPDGVGAADPNEGSGLGILRDPSVKILRRGNELVTITPEVRAFLTEPAALIITKSNVKSRVHRRAHMDYIGVKLFDAKGNLTGELRVAGLFTSTAYNASARSIPYLRRKVANVFGRAGYLPDSYSGRGLDNVIESYPRDDLFQIDEDTLLNFSLDILNLSERPRIRVLARLDRFDRFVSIMVYIPKDRYDTNIRRKVGALLARAYEGRLSAAYPAYPEGPLSRTHYVIGRDEGQTPIIARETLEQAVAKIVRTWADDLREVLQTSNNQAASLSLFNRYSDAFSAAYREAFSPADSLADIATIESLTPEHPRTVVFNRREGDASTRASLKVFALGEPIALSSRVPLLEDMGFTVINERTYRVTPLNADEASRVWLHDMTLERKSGAALNIEALKPRVEGLMMALFSSQTESDGYNALIHEAEIGWRDIAVLRCYSRYLRQIKFGLGQEYLWSALNRYPESARNLGQLFTTRFDPNLAVSILDRAAKEAEISAAIDADLANVSSLDDDRILRRFLNLIQSTIRTNFYQREADGSYRQTIAMKFKSNLVEGLPLPRPEFEIYMDSPRVEGLHLRFGKVARGGLRWSDRPQDFRTEILGLVKAQQVKNAVIVPVGAKGGFVPKLLPPSSNREAWLKEGTEAYKIFIASLLELTDNLVDEKLIPPQNTVRHDQDDPYLVVAADKGTATFSDTANAISLAKHHWLGDAFASGGSVGYDHKKMGITARGAWEAVKRHFREINIDIQTTPFTVVGVGDMSGDVFGNGMLLSPAIKLIAAFDHRDIFLDPTPDIAKTFTERQRMFDLPRSSWQDFDKNLISKGGGIFSRNLKEMPLSPEVQAMLNLFQTKATPQEVMTAILKAQADLLWFGGIGTYICASGETNEQVSDRANDAIRITGSQVQAKVIGEGANLGATQLGRIEAAQAGVRLNTDAIDNSAGVNTSDVEVNIKIALAKLDGELDADARIKLLASMTDEVGTLVLRNNYLQSLALSMSQTRKLEDLPYQRNLMLALEKDGRLDRKIEFLPDESAIIAREKLGACLTRPELSVLLAYAKLSLHDAILASDAPDDHYFERDLLNYFPQELSKIYPATITTHRLRREIISTQLANSIINRGGLSVLPRLLKNGGMIDAAKLARSYIVARDVFALNEINAGIDALDAKIAGDLQLELYTKVQTATLELLSWFMKMGDFSNGVEAIINRFSTGVDAIRNALPNSIKVQILEATEALVAQSLPSDIAMRIAELPYLNQMPDIVNISDLTKISEDKVTLIVMASDEALQFNVLKALGNNLRTTDIFDGQARDMAVERIALAHRSLAINIINSGQSYEDWATKMIEKLEPVKLTIAQIVSSGMSVSKLTIAAGLLGDLSS